MKKMVKRWLISLIVLALIAGGVWWYLSRRRPKTVRPTTATVKRLDIKETVSGPGVIHPERQIEFLPPVADEVEEVRIKEGDRVSEDEVLVELDNYGKLKSPIDGTVIQLDATVGQIASPGKPLLVIADFEPTYFVANIDEGDIARVSPGLETAIVLDAYPDKVLIGEVESIGLVSEATTGGGTAFPVKIRLTDHQGATLRVGMNGDADITISVKQSVLSVPIEAVTEREGKEVVFVIENGRVKKRQVVLGLVSDTDYEVVEGLRANEKVVVKDLSELKGGEMVR